MISFRVPDIKNYYNFVHLRSKVGITKVFGELLESCNCVPRNMRQHYLTKTVFNMDRQNLSMKCLTVKNENG